MRKCDLRTVIAPSGYARLSDIQISENRLIRSPLEFLQYRKVGGTIYYILISSLCMTGTVKAECTPTPDCATMGYKGGVCTFAGLCIHRLHRNFLRWRICTLPV